MRPDALPTLRDITIAFIKLPHPPDTPGNFHPVHPKDIVSHDGWAYMTALNKLRNLVRYETEEKAAELSEAFKAGLMLSKPEQ
jgi:hypothetical protein